MSANHALMIINRKSRSGAAEAEVQSVVELLRARGLVLIEVLSDTPGEIPALIRRHQGQVDRVILGGGDGTLNAAAEALLETGLPLGILPLGTANDLARTLAIPTTLAQAGAIIAAGHRRSVDLGRVNDRYFFNAAHIGLGVRVTHHLSPEIKARLGVLGYARSLLGALRKNRSFYAHIVYDGRHLRTRSIEIAVGNGRYYGGGMTIAQDAAIDNHRLALYSIEPLPWWRLLALAPALRSGRQGGYPGVKLLSAQEITIETRRPMAIDTDGELTTRTPARFQVIAGALSVYAPEPSPSPASERPDIPLSLTA